MTLPQTILREGKQWEPTLWLRWAPGSRLQQLMKDPNGLCEWFDVPTIQEVGRLPERAKP